MAEEQVRDPFFGEEASAQFDAQFDAADGTDSTLGDPEPSPKKRKPTPSWVIIVGAFVVVGAVMGGLSLYRGMKSGGGVPDMAMNNVSAKPIQSAPQDLAPPPPASVQPPVAQPDAAAQPPTASSLVISPAAAAPAPALAPAPAATQVTVMPAQQVQAAPAGNEEDLIALTKRVSDLEARLDTLSKRSASAPVKSAPASAPARPSPKASRPLAAATAGKKAASPETSSGKGESKPALAGLRLRNITEGQAWIEDADGKTSVVGVGDSVAGATITRINPDAFRVDTDRGPVTFAATRQ